MKKTNIIALAAIALFVIGAVFVSAHLESEVAGDDAEAEPSQPQQVCGPNTCNGLCRGGCGVPKCGCGR